MGRRGVAFFSATALVLLFVASGNALFPHIYEHDSPKIAEFKKTLQQVDIPKLFENAEASSHMDFEQSPRRTKRAAGFGGDTCNPGWTGASCEFPICSQPDFHDHNVSSVFTYVDIFYARSSSDFFFIYVDNTMHSQQLQLQSDSGPINPTLVLLDSNGKVYNPTEQSNTPDRALYTFNYLPVQTYKVQLNSDNPAGTMLLMYNAYTYLTTEIGGFTYQFLDDYALHNDSPSYTFYSHTPTVFVAAPVGLESPGSLATVSFFSDTVPAPHNLRLDLRYGCHFLYYTSAFTCGAEGHFYARLRGFDFFGHSFTRIHAFTCEIPLPTTPPPTLSTTLTTGTGSPPPFRCMNGGVPINRNGTMSCWCNGLYTGTYCGTPLCMNNGEVRGGLCICGTGFSGSHCQNVQCEDNAGSGTRVGTPILTFVIRVRTQMSSIIAQVRGAVTQVINDLQYDPQYVSRFGLVLFNNNVSTTYSFNEGNQLITQLTNAAATADSSGGCTDIAFESIYAALNTFIITNKSPIYVITDAEPFDSEDYVQGIMNLNSYYQAPIHFFFVQAGSPCQNMDFQSHPFEDMRLLARRFSGLASYVSTDLQASFQDFIYTHLSHTYHKSHLVFGDDQFQCENVPQYIPISVDVQFHELVFITEGNITNVQLNSPEGDVVAMTNQKIYGNTHIYWLTGLQMGTWTLTIIPVTGRVGCYVRVYAVEEPTPQLNGQDYHLVYGITPSLTLDAPARQPLIGLRQSIVAHIENYRIRDPWKLNAEIVVYTDGNSNNQGRDFVMASNGVWRSGCTYEIYFPPFRCFQEGLNMYFTIWIRDSLGYAIQRAGTFFCVASHPTPSPQPGQCLNGGVSYNGTCVCPLGWSGDACQTRTCFNNGTLSTSGYCQCPPGTGGEWCQLLRCITPNTRPGFGTDGRHMVFILDVTKNNAPALVDLSAHVAEVIRDIQSQQRSWITRYFVIGADSQGVYRLGDAGNDDVGQIQTFFQAALNMSTSQTADSSCTIKLYEAIRDGMQNYNDRSYITIFTSAAPDESQALNSTLPAYDAVLRGRHLLNIFAASTSSGNFACGQPIDYRLLTDLADVTTGRLLPILKVEFYLAMKLIPTWYTSSMVYRRTFDDCSNNATIFAPIDSFTQSVQVYLNGQTAGSSGFVAVIPNGTEYDNIVAYISDPGNGIGVYDLRRPCDGGWEPMPANPYCFSAFYSFLSWDDARTECSNAGGFLVDDLTNSKDTWLNKYSASKQIWLGLNSKNGSYYWDRGIGVTQESFNGSIYSNWAGGDGSVDPNKPCVYRDSDGFWKKDVCSAGKLYICQKHLYTTDYEPNDINEGDLPGGRWMFSFKTPGSCTIEVRVQSSIIVYAGFTTHLLEDYPLDAGVSSSTDNRLIAHMDGVVAPNHIPFLRFAHVLDPVNGTLYRAATYQYRTNCAYEYLSQTFTCPNTSARTNRFEIMHVGEDEYGLPFQRVTSSICEAARVTCGNGGLIYNGLCVCNEYWQGQYCEVPICVNGGFLNTADNTCQCPTGYGGRACQYDLCFNNANITFSPDGKAFVVVVEATTQNQVAVQDFGSQLNDILNAAPTTWFTSYVLVTFDANGVTQVQPSTSQADFVSKYNAATATLSGNNNCDLPIFKSLTAALSAATIPGNSVIYLITTGGSSTTDQNSIGDYWNVASNTNSILFYFLIKSDSCTNEVTSANSMIVTDIAVGTDGNILEVSNNNVGKLAKQHLPSLYNGTVVGTPTLQQNNTYSCQNLVFYVPVGISVTKVFLYSWSSNSVPSVTGPDGTTVLLVVTHIDQNSVFSSFTPPQQGIYTITMNDSGTCMLQARIQGGAEIYPAYVSVPDSKPEVGNHLDNATAVPSAGMNILVAGVLNEFVELQYASLYSPNRAQGEIQYIQMYYRFGCSYNYYSDPFICDEGGYFITFYGLGYGGQPFYRASYTKCLGYNPNATSSSPTSPMTFPTIPTVPTVPVTGTGTTTSTLPPTTSYGYLNVPADVVLILDGSETVTAAQITDIKNILTGSLGQYTIDKNYINLAIIVVLGDQFSIILVKNPFSSIVTTQGLTYALNNAYQNDDFAPYGTGQKALARAVNQLANADFLNRGYRNGTNHLTIYVTTTSSPDTDAVAAAKTIMDSNLFKFLAIGYGNGANQAALTSFVGGNAGCTIVSSDQQTITNAIVNKLWNADGNGGNYCV